MLKLLRKLMFVSLGIFGTCLCGAEQEPDLVRALSLIARSSPEEIRQLADKMGVSTEDLEAAQKDLQTRLAQGTTLGQLAHPDLCLEGLCKPRGTVAQKPDLRIVDDIKLLTENFYSKEQVVSDARSRASGKKFALVILKSHACDRSDLLCIKGTQTLLDRYNDFVRDNFVLYHARLFRDNALLSEEETKVALKDGSFNDSDDGLTSTPGARRIVPEWFVVPPVTMQEQIKVLDLESGKVIGSVGIEPLFGRIERMQKLKSKLLEIPQIKQALGQKKFQVDSLNASKCTDPECSSQFMGAALEDQFQRVVRHASEAERAIYVERARGLIESVGNTDKNCGTKK